MKEHIIALLISSEEANYDWGNREVSIGGMKNYQNLHNEMCIYSIEDQQNSTLAKFAGVVS